jgi:glycosyltransferase involved in cell wall biosynthesis
MLSQPSARTTRTDTPAVIESPARVALSALTPRRAEPSAIMSPTAAVSIVIPAFNEEAGIAGVLAELVEELNTRLSGIPAEVLVVDDGSTDRTAEQAATVEDPRVRVCRHDRNRGYGAAIKTGVRLASHPWVLITDADGTYPNEFIAPLLAERGEHDMVVGARRGAVAKIPLIRRPAKWVLGRLAAYLTRVDIPDLNSGLRVMRKDLVERHMNLLPDGFSLTTTITLALISSGNRVQYLPINYLRRKGASKIRPVADTLNFLMLILRTIAYFEPLRVFIPAAAFFFACSILVAALGHLVTGRVLDGTIVMLFVTGVHLTGLGIVADMLSRRMRS